jgi:hypothetical protein
MSKAMFVVAAALGLAVSPAWAGEEKSDERAASDTVARPEEESASKNVSVTDGPTAVVVEAGRDGATMKESNEVRASHDEQRWLREREGYRDGGY